MRAKVITGVLRRKVRDWLEHVEDPEIQKLICENAIITGGCITSLLLDEPVGDFDVYLKTQDAARRVGNYYLKRFSVNPPPAFHSGQKVKMYIKTLSPEQLQLRIQSAGVASEEGDGATYEYFESSPGVKAETYLDKIMPKSDDSALINSVIDGQELGDASNPEQVKAVEAIAADMETPKATGPGAALGNKYRPVFLSGNAITLADRIQLCIRFAGSAAEIHTNFDFVHCTNWYDVATGELHLNPDAVQATLTRELRYVGSKFPLCSIIRTRKFIKRGWYINAGQFVKMAIQIAEILKEPVSIETWTDQLTGVDAAYFMEMINTIAEDKAAGKTIDSCYIVGIIDRMF
jgi:hypothetical protein